MEPGSTTSLSLSTTFRVAENGSDFTGLTVLLEGYAEVFALQKKNPVPTEIQLHGATGATRNTDYSRFITSSGVVSPIATGGCTLELPTPAIHQPYLVVQPGQLEVAGKLLPIV